MPSAAEVVGRHASAGAKQAAEVGEAVEATVVGDFRHGERRLLQEQSCVTEARGNEVVHGTCAEECMIQHGKPGGAQAGQSGHLRYSPWMRKL